MTSQGPVSVLVAMRSASIALFEIVYILARGHLPEVDEDICPRGTRIFAVGDFS